MALKQEVGRVLRTTGGGLRFGEMESQAIICHSAPPRVIFEYPTGFRMIPGDMMAPRPAQRATIPSPSNDVA